MQKARERHEPLRECIGCAADQEAAEVASATLAGLTRALCVPCLRRLLTLRPAVGGGGGRVGAPTMRMAMSIIATAAAAELERRDREGGRAVSVRLCEAPGCGNTLEGRGPLARTCSRTCSNRVSARRGMHKRRHPACARDPVLDPHRHLARGGVK